MNPCQVPSSEAEARPIAGLTGLRPLLWLWGAQVAGIAAGVVFAAVTARTMAPAGFALLGVWQVLQGYGTVCAEFGTAHVGPRRMAGADPAIPTEGLPSAVFALRALGAVLGSVVTCLSMALGGSGEAPWVWYVLLAVLPLLTAACAEWWHLGLHDERRVAGARLARHACILAGALWLCWERRPWAAVGVYSVAALAQTSFSWRGLPRLRLATGPGDLRSLVRECWPLALALLAQQWVWSGALVTSAGALSAEDFGALVIGFRCYAVGLALLAGYAAYLLPRSAAARVSPGDGFTRWMRLVRRRACLATAALALGAPLAGWVVVPLVFGARYPAVPLLSTLYLLALIPVVWRITSSNTLVALGHTRAYCAASLAAAFCAFLLLLLLPREMLFAPVLAAAFGETLFAIAAHLLLRSPHPPA